MIMPEVKAGGGTGGDKPEATVGAETPKPGEPGSPTPTGGEAGVDGDGGKPTEVLPETLEDALAVIKDNAGKNDELQKMLTESNDKFEDLSKKVGKQSDQIGTLRRLQELQKKNPKELIASIAKDAGVSVNFTGTTAPDLSDVFELEDPQKIQDALKHTEEQAYTRLKAEFGPQLEAMFETQLKDKYPDFDDLVDDRNILSTKVLSKEMTHLELFHLAAIGANMAAALEQAKTQGKEDFKKELSEKAAGAFPEGGEHPTITPKKYLKGRPIWLFQAN
jgi:hypothetical protein